MVKIPAHLCPCSNQEQAAGVPTDWITNCVDSKKAQKAKMVSPFPEGTVHFGAAILFSYSKIKHC